MLGLSYSEWVRKKDAEKRLKRKLLQDAKKEIRDELLEEAKMESENLEFR